MRRRVFALCAVACLAACSPQRPAGQASPSPLPPHGGRGPWLHITGTGTARQPVRWTMRQKNNQKEYDLIAHSYESSGTQGMSVATFFDVHVTFYGTSGSRLAADASRAIVDEAQNTIALADDVRARSASGMTLRCDRLQYDRSTQTVHGEGHVVMTDGHGMRATGNSVDTDITLTHASMQ